MSNKSNPPDALPPGAIPVPEGAHLLTPESGASGFVEIRDGWLLYTHEEPEYPGVYFSENTNCVDDPEACDEEFLVAARAVLGHVGPLS